MSCAYRVDCPKEYTSIMHCFKEDTCFLYITFETKYKSASYRDIKKSDHSQKDTDKIRCIDT